MSELQRIVDSLARTTRRAVSVHDRSRNLLAFSSHEGVIDEVRKESILTRKGPARGFEWAKSFGIETADGPVRIPANDDLGMEARVCAPVRFGGRLLGFLWLVDPDETLEPELFEMVAHAADSAALAINHQELADEIDRGRERELLRDLLSEEPDVREHASADLIESGALAPAAFSAVLVVRPLRDRKPMLASALDAMRSPYRNPLLAVSAADVDPADAARLEEIVLGAIGAAVRDGLDASVVDDAIA